MDEDVEENPGGFMPVNNDYDEQNQQGAGYVPDNEPDDDDGHRIVAGDNELRPATLYISAAEDGASGTWNITFPDKVKLWLWKPTQQKWVEIPSGYSETQDMPVARSFLVEGIEHSDELRDVVITASVGGGEAQESGGGDSPPTGGNDTDTAKLTVVSIDSDVDSDNDKVSRTPNRTRMKSSSKTNRTTWASF